MACPCVRKQSDVIVVCAWCGQRKLGIGGDWVEHDAAQQAVQRADDPISHGMCPDCLTSFR